MRSAAWALLPTLFQERFGQSAGCLEVSDYFVRALKPEKTGFWGASKEQIWIHTHVNSYMKGSFEFIVYMNSYVELWCELLSIWIHVYGFIYIYIYSELVYEFISIWIHLYEFRGTDFEFINVNSYYEFITENKEDFNILNLWYWIH